MSLFQKSVVKGYLDRINPDQCNAAYHEYVNYFHHPGIQQNIRNSTEEQFQEGFLRELFVKILGYTLNPDVNYNLITEQRNVADSKKADGAIIINDKITGVIELKGTSTINLDKVQQQAFYYLSAHPEAVYVITSNFEKLRFYIQKSNEYEEFNLFLLSQEEFKLMYLCISHQSISAGIPLKVKQESVVKEENITKQLYKDYSSFKQDLFTSLCGQNADIDKLTLFKASQKLIDRFLFILFCEDNNGLLPANSIGEIIKHWNKLREMDEYRPLYDIFKKYFEYINSGRPASGDKQEIFAFNGGLFSNDPLLDQLNIDDNVLYTHTKKLSTYDFISEVDVNILGHIFEHSLNEIEEIQAELEGNPVDKSKTKRKKDGVFYTPKYITEYIVENTVGKLCSDKKAELGIDEDEFVSAKSSKERAPLQKKLFEYRDYLLSLTICDPACGSGAFLNQAFIFLQKEHQYIADLESKLFDAPMVISDVSADILENNLFGVDINEESVEIARLSLWLRSAKKGRKLNNLSDNIKCGNSLIDDPEVAGNKAFKWEVGFPQVFANGGFNVVIGNPPYGAKLAEEEKIFLSKTFRQSTTGKIDSYRIFIDLSFRIACKGGLVSMIVPNTFLYNIQSFALRELILNNTFIYDAVELRKNIFKDAPDIVTVIISIKNLIANNYNFRARVALHNYLYYDINSSLWDIDQVVSIENLRKDPDLKINLRSNTDFNGIKQKINKFDVLGDYFLLKQGTKPYGVKGNKKENLLSNIKAGDAWEKAINGRNIARYFITFDDDYVNRSPDLHSVLDSDIINSEKLYFQRMRKISLFPRIVASYDNNKLHGLYTCSVIYKRNDSNLDIKYLLCLINSKLINVWYKYFDTDIEIKLASVKQIPIPNIKPEDQIPFIIKADILLKNNEYLHQKISRLITRIKSNLPLQNITGKLEKFYEHDFKTFVEELKKQKLVLSLKDQDEWEDYFLSYKKEINDLQAEIAKTDKEIDQMVYELYGLTEEEIKVVEGA